ncbi:hypothetical protein BJF84_26590 [Rhodococcus sp. CUA-806]|nr:hypothetical protein BJF84_26590 [Rhodococcus sp. CUA-806]
MEGSPLLLIERGVGQNPDRYALVPTKTSKNDPEQHQGGSAGEFAVESVHPAWSVLGWRQKMLYDTVAATDTAMTAEELFTAVGIGRTSGYEALGDLRVAGLLVLDGAIVIIGAADLDDIGHRHGLTAAVRARIVRHRAERIVWREWLAAREEARTPPDPALSLFTVDDVGFERFDEYYLADVLDTGPPDH